MTGQNELSFHIDTDECSDATHSCHVNGTCHDTVGSYDCVCSTGFVGDGYNCTG